MNLRILALTALVALVSPIDWHRPIFSSRRPLTTVRKSVGKASTLHLQNSTLPIPAIDFRPMLQLANMR